MAYQIKKVGVIGAGTMGGGIASLIAGTGVPVVLLDVPADGPNRNAVVKAQWERQRKSSPAALFAPEGAHLVTLGNTEDDFELLRECDWIIEVIIEQLAPKQQLMARIERVRQASAMVSSNTSGIPIGQISAHCTTEFKQHFLGTHFFNPPRYLKLLEVIPTPDTLPTVTAFIKDFGSTQLGKGVVVCKDTPGFIANRIGALISQTRMLAAIEQGFGVEEIDAMTGTPIGNPRTATFRLADLVGIDVLVHLTQNQYAALPGDEQRERFKVPAILQQLFAAKALGNKTGAGFYKPIQTATGKVFHVLNLASGQYEPPSQPNSPLADLIQGIDDVGARYQAIFTQLDMREGRYLIDTTLAILSYAANRIPEISDSIVDIDNAMKWGFNSALGPFEIWDTIGVREGVAMMRARQLVVPQWVDEMLAAGTPSFYQRADNRVVGVYAPGVPHASSIVHHPSVVLLNTLAGTSYELKRNASASLFDLGDGVLGLEFHGKGNTLDAAVYDMGNAGLDLLEIDGRYRAMLIGSQAKDFCLGANISVFLQAAQTMTDDHKQLETTVRDLQEWLMRVRFASKPVVTAPYGRVLGGGAEVMMAGAQIVAATNTHVGLVELAVGVIPAGGGCKELLRRNVSPHALPGQSVDVMPYLLGVFETILHAKISEDAQVAQARGFIKPSDTIVMNDEHVLGTAKHAAIALAEAGYSAPHRSDKSIYAVGSRGKAVLLSNIEQLRWGKFITDHDALIARQLAHVLCGGDLSAAQWVTEDYILQLEREAFAALLTEPKTQARIAHMLTSGKRLRN